MVVALHQFTSLAAQFAGNSKVSLCSCVVNRRDVPLCYAKAMSAGAPQTFKVGLVQMSCTPNPEENLERAIDRIRDAAGRGARVVCLPELFSTQYFCQREDASLFDLAEPIPGPSTEAIGKVARATGTVVIASLFERRAAGLYHNTAAIVDADGSVRGLYRKMHIPDDPLYYEKYY